MFLDVLQKYKSIVGLLRIKSITSSSVVSILKMLGYNINIDIANLLVDVIKGAGEQYNTNSLYEVLTKPEIVEQIGEAITAIQANNLLPQTQSDPGLQTQNDLVFHADTLVKCPHCSGYVHLRSAYENSK